MPVAILGAARSGTSMLARLLSLCGVYLGQESDMPVPSQYNPKGFWELTSVLNLNERILAHLGGDGMCPPRFTPGWSLDNALAPYYSEAREIVSNTFAGKHLWGWKDPRTALLIPFWKRVVPDVKFVVIVRNPVDVARSSAAWFDYGGLHDYALWHIDYLRIFSDSSPEERVITFFEDYFDNWRAAIKPVLDFLELPMPASGSEAAQAIEEFIDEDLKHYKSTLDDVLFDESIPYPTRQLYVDLRTSWIGDAQQRQAANADALQSFLYPLLRSAEQCLQLKLQLQEKSHLEHVIREQQQILGSRAYRLAGHVCSLLIQASRITGRTAARRSSGNPQSKNEGYCAST